ncbi:MAG: tripartite tricarboxylate transporter TctB family protein [Alkalilacustris sp.]
MHALLNRLLQGDVVIGAILLAGAVWYGLEAQGFRPGRAGDPGAGMFPTILALLLGGLALWMMLAALLRGPQPPGTRDARAAARAGILRAGAAAALTVAFVAVFQTLGYILATAVYAGAIALLFRPRAPLVALLAAVAAAAFLHLLFAVLLNARLPMGLLG